MERFIHGPGMVRVNQSRMVLDLHLFRGNKGDESPSVTRVPWVVERVPVSTIYCQGPGPETEK